MHYRLLGPLQVVHGDQAVDIGPPKQRAVLAVLLLAGGRVVSADRLMDAVWGADVPPSATASLQAYISNLRKALRHDASASPIVRQAPGYYLVAEHVDLVDFVDGATTAGSAIEAGRWRQALAAAEGALELWRGPLVEDLHDEHWVRDEAGRVEEMRIACTEHRITALLALGRSTDAVAQALQLRTADPMRDRSAWLQALALHRAGRTPDALDVVRRHAELLDAELGLEPGAELRDLQTAMLRQAPELAAWPRSPEWAGAADVHTPSAQPAAVSAAPVGAPRGVLVGRARETSSVAQLLADIFAVASRWLVLTGPPGIGKTRLAEEAVTLAAARGAQTVWVSCPDERGTPPWWPMRQLVRALGADADEILEVPPDADPDTARFRVYERIQTLLEKVSRTGPLLIVVDDVQWADPTSASCLAYIAGALRDAPVGVVATVRDGEHGPEVSRLLATAVRGDGNRHIEVPALSQHDVATLANHVADDPEGHLSTAEAAVLADRTGGNPFFVSEYARLPRAQRAGNEIPLAIRSVLDRRLAVLDSSVLQTLRAAAVIGDDVEIVVLAATTGLDVDTLADHLDEAADARIIVAGHGDRGYEFAHSLLREQLLAGMPALRRQRLHAQVADVLGSGAVAEAALTRRAQHLVAALPLVEPAIVVDACRLAAEDATARWSSVTAARWWQAALDAYDRLPAAARTDTERDALTVAMLEALARSGRGQTVLDTVQAILLDALRTGRIGTAGRVARALLRASGGWPWLAPGADPGGLLAILQRAATAAADSEGHSAAEARILAALAVGHCYHDDPTVARAHLRRSLELAEAADDPELVADALMGHLITYSGVATYSEQTLDWARRLIALGHSRIREDAVIAHSVATMAAMNLTDVESAIGHLRAGIEGSEELALPVLRAQLRWTEALLAVWHGDFAEAERHHAIAAHVHEQTELYEAGSGMLAAASLARETGELPTEGPLAGVLPDTSGEGLVGIVRVALETVQPGNRDIAYGLVGRGLGRDQVHVWTSLAHSALLAHLCADHGLREFAPGLLADLAPFTERLAVIGQVGVVGPVALATARLHALLGDAERARANLSRAVAMAERTGGAPTLLRARLLGCQLDADAGDPGVTARARELADAAEQLGMRGLAAAAKRLAG